MENTEKTLKQREDISLEDKWKLEDMYATDEAWEQDFQQLKELTAKISRLRGTLDSPTGLLAALRLQDRLGELNERIFVYARMRRDEDNRSTKYQTLTDRATGLSVEVHGATAFIVPEILTIPEDRLTSFYAEEEDLELYRQALSEITRMRPHVLSASEEELLARTGEMAQAPQNIFSMFNNADLKLPLIRDEQGQEVELTKGNYVLMLESQDRRVRKDAFEGMYRTYGDYQNTVAATLNASVKKDVFFARVRKYDSALGASLDSDNVPTAVYDNLIATVRANLAPLHRYLALRKRALGLDELHMYDLYTPIVQDSEFKITYPEALQRVAEGLTPLGQEYVAVLQEGFNNRWIDVRENQGKTSGAYCWGAYGTHPFVLLNWHDNINNLFTVAHEMGHALHSFYSDREQPYVYAGYKIFVAEVASTVNESLLIDYMLNRTADKKEKLYLLNHYLEEFRGTVYRQTMFAEFEKIIHAKVEAGEALTTETLNETYHELNEAYYGSEVVVDEDIRLEWARIPHFYTNFYVYKYATGFSAATTLSQQILREGEPAVQRYLEFLKGGSSDYPINLLRRAGVDMAKPEPVQEALRVFAKVVDEMEELL